MTSLTTVVSGRFYKLIPEIKQCLPFIRTQTYFSSFEGGGSNGSQNEENKPLVIVQKMRTITTIGINRPEKKNCVNNATALQLMEAFATFEADKESPVAVLYGRGGTFCAGYDLKETAEGGQNEEHMMSWNNFNPFNEDGCGPMGPSRRFLKKPIIAAISGYAVAGGLELAVMCDLRLMEETAVMGVFCRRFGVPLIDGGSVRLPHLIGLGRAMDLILTGRPVKAEEALEMGLVNRVVACGASLGQAITLADEIAKFPQECMLQDRQSAFNAMYNAKSFQSAVEYEMQTGLDVLLKESVPGAQKFVQGIGRHGSFNIHRVPTVKKKYPSPRSKL